MGIVANSLELGGVSSFARALQASFTQQEKFCVLISCHSLQSNFTVLDDCLSLNGKSARSKLNKVIQLFFRLIRAKNILHQYNLDHLICLDPSSYILFLIASRTSFRNRKIKIFACYYAPYLTLWSDRLIIKNFYRFANIVLVPNRNIGELISKNSKLFKYTVITPCLSEDSLFCSLDNKSMNNEAALIYFGRLSEEKRPKLFVEIAKNFPEIRAFIYGVGSQTQLLDVVQTLESANSNVTFCGRGYVSQHFKRGDVLVLTSIEETFGIVIVEALLHGVKVVALSTNAGPKSILEKFFEEGLVPTDSFSDWVNTTSHAIQDSASPEHEREVLETYHSTNIASQVLQLLS